MAKRIARIVLIAGERSRRHILGALPVDGMHDDAEVAYQALLRRGDEGFGGHVEALYGHVDILQSALAGPVPDVPPPDAQ
jgi:hypothetical protein